MGAFQQCEVKHLFVNGSVSNQISLDEILANFGPDDWASAAWSFYIDLTNLSKKFVITYQEIKLDPRKHLTEIWNRLQIERKAALEGQQAKQFFEGQAMYKAMGAFHAPHFNPPVLTFFPWQAKGFLHQQESWNNFCPGKMLQVIDDIEDLGIKSDFGVNNPNTGKDCTSWSNVRDYWRLTFQVDGCNTRSMIEAKDTEIRAILRGANPDAVRIEEDTDRHLLTYVMWWD